MPESRRITNYFKRPSFAVAAEEDPPQNLAQASSPVLSSSPLSDPPLSQSLPPNDPSPQTADAPASQLNQSLLASAQDPKEKDNGLQGSFHSADTGTSFHSSQRVIKNGKEVVISSDGDDMDSIGSFESPEDLFMGFTKPSEPILEPEELNHKRVEGMKLRSRISTKHAKRKGIAKAKGPPPVYKNSLDDLVMQATDDNETEAGIARLRANFVTDHTRMKNSPNTNHKSEKLHEGILTTALKDDEEEEDGHGLQRLLDAVRRTEALDQGKSWSFFNNAVALLPAPDFPRDTISPGTYISVLREPESRERAFHSGIVDFALSREFLPDSLITWLFFSVATESRDTLRHAYCRALKNAPANRIESLIGAEDIDTFFQHLGANPAALAISEPIVPDLHPKDNSSQTKPRYHAPLLSILDIIREAADLFSNNTRLHVLDILLRLTLDVSLTSDSMVCSELERALIAVFESISKKDNPDEVANRICVTIFRTLKDPELQSRLLQHMIPTLDWVTALRRRLAIIFLSKDPSADTGPNDVMFELNRIIDILKEPRFDIKRYKKKAKSEYDYGELGAIVTFLNMIIDSGWSETRFPDKQTKKEFNALVDVLSDRVKKIFTSIEDSGASHLRRTIAKEALESLHYRIVYSVRTKSPPRKILFGDHTSSRKQARLTYKKKKEDQVKSKADDSPPK